MLTRSTLLKFLGFFGGLLPPLLYGNPPPEEWQIIMPEDAGIAVGSAYFPLQNAFDGSLTWAGVAAVPEGGGGSNNAPPYTGRHGYIDFGPNYREVHIMETWTQYRTFSGGSHPGYAKMWWDDDTDNVNDDGIIEERLNFNSGQGMPNVDHELWYRDKRINEIGGIRPQRRYLILQSTNTYADRAREYAIVGYLYDGLVPPEYANQPRLLIDNNVISENTSWRQPVGVLSIEGGANGQIYRVNYDTARKDNDAFRLEGMTLWTNRSFDFEAQSRYQLLFEVIDSGNEITEIELEIEISDLSGDFDTNGLASADLAAAYPEINQGDFVIWNATNSSGPDIRYNAGTFDLSPPNKILIKAGDYRKITLDLTGVVGAGADGRVPITNFLGQVYVNQFGLSNGSYWRLTGKYDAASGFGHRDFTGCVTSIDEEDFGFSNGEFGFWISNEWVNESDSLIYVGGTATGWEIDHVECSDGGFAGMLLKRDNDDSLDMDEVHLHHLYIHDTGSEGIYLGSTQPDPQHQFNKLLIENVVILRTGTEAIQAGQLGNGCMIRNSVFWGSMDWLSPFQRYQDSCAQVGARQGDVTFRNNVLLGAGEKFFNVSVTPKAGIVPNGLPFTFDSNVMWGCHGPHGAYQFKNTDNTTPWRWVRNFWGGFDYSYTLVYPNISNSHNCVLMASNGTTVDIIDNVYDASRDRAVQRWSNGDSIINESGSVQKTVLSPRFLNLLGETEAFDILKWTRWTPSIGEDGTFPGGSGTNKGEPVLFSPGDIVQHGAGKRTRFYRCLQSNIEHEPPLDGDEVWELLSWDNGEKMQYCPPDDVRLVEGSLYHELGIGLGGDRELDSDADDLPDRWERRHGIDDADAFGDHGRDGDYNKDFRTNWEEFVAGTDPSMPDEIPDLEIAVIGESYRLNWSGPKGRAWRLMSTHDLNAVWEEVTLLTSTEGYAEHEQALSAAAQFFKAAIELENSMDLLP